MNSGSSQDTTWTFGGAVAAPAAGESTAEEVAMQSIDSSTEEDKARPTSVATPKTAPKAKNASRASTPSRPTSLGSRAAKGNGRESDAPSLPVMQAVRMTAKRKEKSPRATDRVSKPSSSRSSSSRRSRGSTKVRGRSQTTTGRRILSSETDEQPVPLALTHSNDVTLDTIPAIEDTSPVQLPLPAGERGEGIRMSIRDQLESARMAQQMYRQSEIQKFEGVIQTLVSEMKEMQQEDEGSEIRIQELARQRDTACLAMQHMNNANQEMKNDFELAVARINEHSQAQRHQDYIVTEELLPRLHQERNETAQNLAHIEESSQGDGVVMAKEYEMLTSELHAQARESLRLRANAASSEHALMTLREHLQLVKSEEIVAAGEVVSLRTEGLRKHQHLHDRIGAGFQEQQHLRNRLDEEEEFRSMAMQRMQKAEDQLWQVENNSKHALPTLHGELNELRRALKLQEDVQARTLSELEAARNAHQGFRQPSSSMPIPSRTTESGWECVSRDRVQAFPVGAEIRSPEVHTPSHRSPVNREVFNFVGSSQHTTEGAAPEHLVPRADSQAPERLAQRATLDEQALVRFAQCATSSSASPEKSVTTTSEDARAVRDRQLRDLLMTVGMRERVTSASSSTAVYCCQGCQLRR